jgi:biofilm PGA synthesis N-glycosyltransferase PgaC
MKHLILTILFYIFIVVGIINLIHIAFYLVSANIYDLKNLVRLKKVKTDSQQPLVTVLIPAYNEEKVIERCLKSVWSNSYYNLQILVVNDGSTDKTSQIVQRFMDRRVKGYEKANTKFIRTENGLRHNRVRGRFTVKRQIKLINQRNKGKAEALNHALRRYTRGELVMTLDADSYLDKQAIAKAVSYFDDPNIVGVAANVRIIEEITVLGLLQRYEHMIGYRSKKFFTLANCELIIGGVASTYRKSVLDKVKYYDAGSVTEDIGLSMKIANRGNKKNRLVYGADIVAMTEGVADFRGLLNQRYRWKLGNMQNLFKYRHMTFSRDKRYTPTMTWYRMPMAFLGELLILLEPVSLLYVFYLSIHYFTLGLFFSAYTAITFYILLTVWPDEHLDMRGKLKASLLAPWLYFVFYIMNTVQLVSVIRCLANKQEIISPIKKENVWVSPRRLGRATSFS